MKYLFFSLSLLLSGCGTLSVAPTFFELGEAVESKSEVEQTPDTIETVVTKKDGKIVIESSSPEHSRIPPIELPALETKLDIEKGLKTPPIWLYILVLLSGTMFFINMIRRFVKNKNMRSDEDDTYGIDNDGGRCSDGRSVQIHGQRTEEQAETTRDADANESAEVGSSERRQRVSIQVGRRSSE
jgi:hypothetical protein